MAVGLKDQRPQKSVVINIRPGSNAPQAVTACHAIRQLGQSCGLVDARQHVICLAILTRGHGLLRCPHIGSLPLAQSRALTQFGVLGSREHGKVIIHGHFGQHIRAACQPQGAQCLTTRGCGLGPFQHAGG